MNKRNRSYLNQIPFSLIMSRLVLGILIVVLSVVQVSSFRLIIVAFIVLGLLSDVFDGIIARSLKISTLKLRRLDSSVDQIFWICALFGAFLVCPVFFRTNAIKLLILIIVEMLTYVISFIRFRKEVATHAISSKFWTLSIMMTLIQVFMTCNSVILFNVCFYLGIASRLEIMGILLIIRDWTSDVPSIYHAVQLRKGKTIKRNRLFNG
jgi:CDP-diacylglycerol--glycerol-3-phosphate 3-phosphatidyltransferase